MDTKHPTSIRLSPEGQRLRALLAHKLGISQTAVIELALRDKAKHEHLDEERPHARLDPPDLAPAC